MRWLFILCLFLGACTASVPEPEGYRMNKYKAPVPQTVPGGLVLDTQKVAELHQTGKVVFVDVIGSGKFLTEGIDGDWLSIKPRLSIPNSVWLPDVGRGALTSEQTAYFRNSLVKLTKGDDRTGLVFFCLKSCWMSWNAAKRAASYGYKNVMWYPQGTAGWKDAGFELEAVMPFSRR